MFQNCQEREAQDQDLEKIPKVALLIILGEEYSSCDGACKRFDISTLSSRRAQLCSSFAVKLFKGPRSEQFFTLANQCVNARNEKKLINENICRTTRCYNAPHNYLNRLVNENIAKSVKK